MRRGSRLTSLAASVTLVVGPLGVLAVPASADENSDIEWVQAEEVDLSPQDAGRPAGDGDNAVDTEAIALDRGARLAVELSHALGSQVSQDMRGFETSLYRGKWFMPAKEDRRRCIMDREANNDYRAVSRGGTYRGAYQMTRGLAVATAKRMAKEVKKELGPEAATVARQLTKIPTQQWNRYWQDRAFWTIWQKGKGAFHWGGGAWHC
jgi:hypothetical protein